MTRHAQHRVTLSLLALIALSPPSVAQDGEPATDEVAEIVEELHGLRSRFVAPLKDPGFGPALTRIEALGAEGKAAWPQVLDVGSATGRRNRTARTFATIGEPAADWLAQELVEAMNGSYDRVQLCLVALADMGQPGRVRLRSIFRDADQETGEMLLSAVRACSQVSPALGLELAQELWNTDPSHRPLVLHFLVSRGELPPWAAEELSRLLTLDPSALDEDAANSLPRTLHEILYSVVRPSGDDLQLVRILARAARQFAESETGELALEALGSIGTARARRALEKLADGGVSGARQALDNRPTAWPCADLHRLLSAVQTGDRPAASAAIEDLREAAVKGWIDLHELRDLDGRTVLHVAAQRGDLELVGALLELFGDSVGEAAYCAAFEGHTAVLDALRGASDVHPLVALNHAIHGGHAACIDLLLSSIEDLDRRPPEGDEYDLVGNLPRNQLSPLEFAAHSGNLVAIRKLLAAGVPATGGFFRDYEIHTAAGYAARAGDLEALTLLLDAGANLHLAHEVDGEEHLFSLLCLAAEGGNPDLVDLLIERGSEVDQRDSASFYGEGRTALMVAAQYGHPGIARRLLERGADPSATCPEGGTALSFALEAYGPRRERDPVIYPSADPASGAAYGKLQVAEALIAAGAPLDADAIGAAAGTGSIEIVEFLVERGLDLSGHADLTVEPDSEGGRFEAAFYDQLVELRPGPPTLACVGLGVALAGQDLDMVSFFLPHARTLHVESLTEVFEKNQTELALALIEQGFDFEALIDSPWNRVTALTMAAEQGNALLVEALLAAGADPNHISGDGDTALTAAIKASGRSQPTLIMGAPDFLNSGQLASWQRRSGNHVETVRALLRHGADPRQPDPVLPEGLLEALGAMQAALATRDDASFLSEHAEAESLQALLDETGSADVTALMRSSEARALLVPLLTFHDLLLKQADQHSDLWTRDLALGNVPSLALQTDNNRLTPELFPAFRTEGSFTASLQLPAGLEPASRRELLNRISQSILGAPGVTGFVFGSYVPFLDEPALDSRIDHESTWEGETEVTPIDVAAIDVSHGYFARMSMAFKNWEGGFHTPLDRPSIVVTSVLGGNELHMHLPGDEVVLDETTCALSGRLMPLDNSSWRGETDGARPPIAFRNVYESEATEVGVLIDTSLSADQLAAMLAERLADARVTLLEGTLRDLDAPVRAPLREWTKAARDTEYVELGLTRKPRQGGLLLRRTAEGWRLPMPSMDDLPHILDSLDLVPVGAQDPSSLDLQKAMRTHGILLAAGRVEDARALVLGQLARPESEVETSERFAMLNALANDQLQLGRLQESEDALLESLDLMEGERNLHQVAALVHSNLIVLYGLTGDAEASAASEAALSSALVTSVRELDHGDRERLARDVEMLLLLHGNLANYRILSGRYELARETLNRASELLRRLDGKASASERNFQMMRGNLALFSGQMEAARSLFQDVLLSAGVRNSERDLLHAVALGNLSMVEEYDERWEEASQYRSQSITRMEALVGEDSPDYGLALIQAGDLAVRTGDLPAGLEHYSRAATILDRLGSSNLGLALIGAGTAQALAGDLQASLETLEQAAANVRGTHGTEHRNYAALCSVRGVVHLLAGDAEAARAEIETGIAIFEQERGQFTNELDRREYLRMLTRAYETLAALHLRSGDLDAAFETIERFRAKTLLELLTSERVSRTSDHEDEVLGELDRVRQDLRLMESSADPSIEGTISFSAEGRVDRNRQQLERRRELGAQRTQLLANLRTLNPELAGTIEAAYATAQEVRAALTEGEVLVEYFELPDLEHPLSTAEPRLMAFVLTAETIEVREVAPSARALMEQAVVALTRIKGSRGLEYEGDEETPELPLQRSQRMFDLVLTPLADLLEGDRLTVVPTGGLHYLPWAALHDGERWLSERYQLAVAPSASVVVQLRSRPAPTGQGLLALGNPDGHLGRLDGAEAEVEALARLFADPTIRMGVAATEESLRRAAPPPRIVHVASHGVFDASRPELSHLALTPQGSDDGRLEVHEAYGLPFDETQLVVLSACNTATGVHSGGDEVVGLSRAFFVSGARTVVSSLWSVPDAATATLMVAMYEELLRGDVSPSEALRRAQAKLRADPETAHPYYWAGFQVMGLGW